MTALLASVQGASDTAPITWGYFLRALALASLLGGGLLLMAYRDSHRRRRRNAGRRRP